MSEWRMHVGTLAGLVLAVAVMGGITLFRPTAIPTSPWPAGMVGIGIGAGSLIAGMVAGWIWQARHDRKGN